jgi:hypothetical protein
MERRHPWRQAGRMPALPERVREFFADGAPPSLAAGGQDARAPIAIGSGGLMGYGVEGIYEVVYPKGFA